MDIVSLGLYNIGECWINITKLWRIYNSSSKTHSGRAWRAYARVLFYKTSLSKIIVPSGWDAWSYKGHE
uniref:Pectinesterase catalytic domain-containing protein n=1 Tax=Solanum lycopersicum TaxID=4081 RepID=A0A3Q7EWS4_SOLLC